MWNLTSLKVFTVININFLLCNPVSSSGFCLTLWPCFIPLSYSAASATLAFFLSHVPLSFSGSLCTCIHSANKHLLLDLCMADSSCDSQCWSNLLKEAISDHPSKVVSSFPSTICKHIILVYSVYNTFHCPKCLFTWVLKSIRIIWGRTFYHLPRSVRGTN